MTTLSPGDIMLAAALVFGLATACQVVAPLLRIPALILLLPAGFLLGVVAPQLRADQILGPAFPVMVDLMVAVILFQGGMKLGDIQLQGADRSVVRRLIWIGGGLTFIAGAVATHFLLGFPWPLAILLGAILIVSGPTVVTPILDFVQPKPRVRGILMWEGTLLDPLGAIFAVVIFQVVRASDANAPVDAALAFLASLGIAIIVAAAGFAVLVLGVKLVRGNGLLGTQVLIGAVILAAGFANFLASGSGLLAALLMGAAVSLLAKRLNMSLTKTDPFFDTVVAIGIGVLFISIAALVPSPAFTAVALPAVAMAIVLILVVRPFVAFVCTGRAQLSRNERTFIGCMDPRGIVAAATASSVGAALVTAKVAGAEKLLPAAFVIIAVTVFVYGLTAVPVAQALGLREKDKVE
jgi:NhaP-type Na+/H+ or K+/H+ antiporter